MATVRFSNEFKNSVIKNAENMFNGKVNHVINTEVPSHWAEHIYTKMFGQENIDKMNALDEDYFEVATEIRFSGFSNLHNSTRNSDAPIPTVCDAQEYKADTLNDPSRSDYWNLYKWSGRHGFDDIRMKFNTRKRYPARLPEGRKGCTEARIWSKSLDITLSAQDDRWSTLWGEWVEFRMKIEKVVFARKKFITGVTTIMDTYNTLGPALKVFPGLWDLLEDKYKDRHKAEDKKANAKTVAKELSSAIDVNSMTAQVTAHKLTK